MERTKEQERAKRRVREWWASSIARGRSKMPWYVQSLVRQVENDEGLTFDMSQGRWVPKS